MSEQRTVASLEPLAPVMAVISGENKLDSLTNSVKVLRNQVKEILPLYSAANYSEDNLKDAKADRATLNKFKTALNEKKIAFKKEFMKPFEDFETVVKETMAEIDAASGAIDKVVKDVENRDKLARQALIDELWKATGFTLVPLCQVQKPEWSLKATSKKAITEGIAEIQNEIIANIAMLEQMVKPEDRPVVKLNFLEDLDFRRAMGFAQRVKLQREERENKPIESAPVAPAPPLPSAPAAVSKITVQTNMPDPPADDPVISRTFKVTVPKSVMIRLGDFMKANDIPFEVVAKS